jgi:hypothetical protein
MSEPSIQVKGVKQTLTPARPAETMTGVAGVGYLLATILGVDSLEAQSAMIATLAILPGLVSGIIANGGIVGFVKSFLYGRDGN